MSYKVTKGKSHPIGTHRTPEGTNFCIYSKHATAVDLLFFDHKNDSTPSEVFHLTIKENRSFQYWHICIDGVKDRQLYGFKVRGKNTKGNRFDREKLLLDPYAKAVAIPDHYSRIGCALPGDNTSFAMKSIYIDEQENTFDWEGDLPLNTPYDKTTIYELHVKGFTKNPNSGVTEPKRGTFLGVIDKIPYLKSLGISAVELMPVQQFDPQDAPIGLNYWGYSPIGFFAPHHAYGTNPDDGSVVNEFKTMVKALHSAGIEVILDVVFNHTAEGGDDGPTLCFKGLFNSAFYILDENKHDYLDYTGCGNTINANHSVSRRFIMDSLRYWVEEMHVDGFRFDLASVLSRDINGAPIPNPPIIWQIETDPILANTKLIAEAWDAAGLYQVGNFIGNKWSEWNGIFRDDIRRFVKGEDHTIENFIKRFLGSPDIYNKKNDSPAKTINFIACHDGYTLNDVVSYEQKHNLANGENNNDGHNHNISCNYGIEGPTDDPNIEKIRLQQIKNLFVFNLLSFGVPMITMGDEMRRTQYGNNNAYCQDNIDFWLDWSLEEKNEDLIQFVKRLIEIKNTYMPVLPSYEILGYHDTLQWHGINLNEPDLNPNSHSISMTLKSNVDNTHFQVLINMYWEKLEFELDDKGQNWRKIIDTALTYPDDCHSGVAPCIIYHDKAEVQAHSLVILQCKAIH